MISRISTVGVVIGFVLFAWAVADFIGQYEVGYRYLLVVELNSGSVVKFISLDQDFLEDVVQAMYKVMDSPEMDIHYVANFTKNEVYNIVDNRRYESQSYSYDNRSYQSSVEVNSENIQDSNIFAGDDNKL